MEAVMIGMMAVGTLMQFSGQRQQAKAAEVQGQQAVQSAEYTAVQQEQNATQEIAAAQRQAHEEKRRAKLIASRALAIAGASGGSASDPTVVNMLADLEGEGAYRASVAIYEGEERARQMRQGAATSRYEGQIGMQDAQSRSRAYKTMATGSLISGASSLYSKYAGGGVGAQQPPAPVEDRNPPDPRFR